MALSKLFVIIDPTSDTQPAFERGLASARDTGASLHLYACATPDSGAENLEAAREAIAPMLDGLVERATAAEQEAASEIEWAEDWASQAVQAAARCGASMIFNNSTDHDPMARERMQTSDWTLLRHAPCPVLMVKNFHDWQNRKVLAAINPAATESAHVKLNHQITSLATELGQTYGSSAHYVIAFQDLNHAPRGDKVAKDCGVATDQVHIRLGKAAEVIRDVAQELDVDLIIVGTVARDGIKGRVIGNTCERLLDQTHSDVLVLN